MTSPAFQVRFSIAPLRVCNFLSPSLPDDISRLWRVEQAFDFELYFEDENRWRVLVTKESISIS